MTKAEYPFENHTNGTIRPFIPILVINPDTGNKFKAKAIIDTGADNCAFPSHLAVFTGHNLKGATVKTSINGGIGGHGVRTYKHSFIVCLLDQTGENILYTSKKLLIDCFDHNATPPLLGGNDFLINFSVKFNYIKRKIILKW